MTEDRKRTVCGFIGLGRQGTPIATRMARAGYPTMVWARRPEALGALRTAGMQAAASLLELAAQADHVGICVDGDAVVRDVSQQLLTAMRPGSRLVIHSTALPDTCIGLAREAHLRGIHLIDAPVSGGPQVAAAGELTLMVGGNPDVVSAARPVFESFASVICHLGDIGSGQKAKLINNSLMAANLGLVHSAVSAGVELGLDRQQWMQLLQAGSGRSYASEVYARQSSLEAFSQQQKLTEKIGLLAEVLGEQHPAVRTLRNAADPLAGILGSA